MSVRVPGPQVLRNRGIPVKVHRLVLDGAGDPVRPYQREFDGTGENAELLTDEVWVQLTNAVLADFEDDEIGWGSLDNWQAALVETPYKALVRTFALALGYHVPGMSTPGGSPVPDLRRAGTLMLDGLTDDYATVIGAAFALANGVSPERVGELLRAGVRNAAELRPLIDAEVQKMLEDEEASMAEARRLRDAVYGDGTPTNQTSGTPSPNGSELGSEPAVPSTSSGG